MGSSKSGDGTDMTKTNKKCLQNIDGNINGNHLGDRHLDGRTLIKRI